MLGITLIKGSNQYAAAHYFASGDDYYAKEHAGEWQGEGARILGLTGPVEQKQLSRLFNGQLPNGERIQLTFDRTTNEKRMALDLTFSAPKSVSMQALIAGDKAVTEAHDRAVTKAMREVERLAVARRKVKGKSYHERTSKLVIGKFRHELSRAKDPQLHTHAVILNMTQRSDGAWRSLSNEDIFKVKREIDAVYQTQLAHELTQLGYAIRVVDDKGNFELDHITREQIEAFSARARAIEEALDQKGMTRGSASTLEKQVIAMITRPRKDESDRVVVKRYWIEKSSELGIDFGPRSRLDAYTVDAVRAERRGGPKRDLATSSSERAPDSLAETTPALPGSVTPAQAVVQYAIKHLTEREAVASESDLMGTALRRAVGLAGPDDVRAEIARLVKSGALIESTPIYRTTEPGRTTALSQAGWRTFVHEHKGWSPAQAREHVSLAIKRGSLVPVERRYTTLEALKEEKIILAIERAGRRQVIAFVQPPAVGPSIDAYEREASQQSGKAIKLTVGQRAAVEAIVATNNRFVGIQGDAGTGKTTSVKAAVELIRQASELNAGDGTGTSTAAYRTIALAPYGPQVKALKLDGLDARTVASFLKMKDKPIDGNTLVVLDEAGVIGSRQLAHLMRIVEKAGARMVLIGDTKQTEAIERGKPFAQLQEAGMLTTRISEILRQLNPTLKTAVELTADGQASKSLRHIKDVLELEEPAVRHEAIASDFCALTFEQRAKTLVVTGTNQARRQVTAMVREKLELAGKGRKVEILTRVDTTKAQRRFAPSYSRGMAIQPDSDYPRVGLARGEIYRVDDVLQGNELVLRRSDGTTTTINPRKVTKLSVYELEHAEISVGDTLRVTRNDPARDLTSSDRLRVADVIGPLIRLESVEQKDGRPLRTLDIVADKPLHLDHAYCATVHSAQGLTSDRALMSIDTKSRTTSMNLYYVAISRARHEARVYTNSVKELPEAISKVYQKTTALGIQRERDIKPIGPALKPSISGGHELPLRQREGATGGIEFSPG
ncbi:MobF family relaxase [Variovorax sp. J22P168]|uniref:MobF family relaxase n=1 Tax=Variovorax jilinensis TaxID=3053513 RepID=UPI002576DB0B|nr:MobF family relaxase [Variovorax sp. J22P168]MDM0015037.1 MobF family relaxase [Variovorax sp. J22P168]